MEKLIQHWLYLNLDHRKDRKLYITNELNNFGIPENNITRIPSILTPLCGHLGCGLSHVKALKYAIDNNFDKVAILEDDFKYLKYLIMN